MGMPRRLLLTLGVLLLAVPAAAQDLLPPAFSGWQGEAPSRVASGRLEQVVGDLAPVLREYDALFLETRTYSRGKERLTVTVYRMKDPTGAYGVFTFLRTNKMAGGKLGKHSALSSDRALVMIGDLVLDVSGANLSPLAGDLNGLVSQVYPKARPGPLPTVGDYLPTKEMIANSRRYVGGPVALGRLLPLSEGDWLGFSEGAEAELARYRVRGEEITLLVAAYPTPQVAARWTARIEQLAATAPAGTKPRLVARRSVSLVTVVAGGSSQEAAEALLSAVRYESDVTWNEPKFSATDPSIPEMVLQAIYGTGGILILALVAGIGFGFLRVAIKHFLPGKVFDRTEAVEIIQLGLTSKPIDGKDFYLF